MPTYAILGATGQVGSSILDALLQSSTKSNPKDDIKINVFVRSKQKLLSMRPALASHPNISYYEGQLSDAALLASCIHNTRAVFLCIAAQDNVPNCSIAQEQTYAVLSALEENKTKNKNNHTNSNANPPTSPKLIILSSASLEPHSQPPNPLQTNHAHSRLQRLR
jgi:uncharacterized protein YbjT (DUF2867 family)